MILRQHFPQMGNIPVKDDENGHAFKAAVFEKDAKNLATASIPKVLNALSDIFS